VSSISENNAFYEELLDSTYKAANCVVSQRQELLVEICFFRPYREDFFFHTQVEHAGK
jgi:hypothetical protein